jgi:hypothetical protein
MNNGTHRSRRPRRTPTKARTAVAILCVAALALPATALGGSRSPAGGGGAARAAAVSALTNVRKVLAYSRCMRSHGVLRFPDPSSSGAIPKVSLQQMGVSRTVFQAAQRACQHLLPNSGQSSQAWDQKALTALWNFARCVRAHGVPNWPDPLAESDPGQPDTPGFPRNFPPSIDQDSPVVKHALHACQRLLAGIGYGSGGYP